VFLLLSTQLLCFGFVAAEHCQAALDWLRDCFPWSAARAGSAGLWLIAFQLPHPGACLLVVDSHKRTLPSESLVGAVKLGSVATTPHNISQILATMEMVANGDDGELGPCFPSSPSTHSTCQLLPDWLDCYATTTPILLSSRRCPTSPLFLP
jgi:hypothetical protein